VNKPQFTVSVHFLGERLRCLLSGGRTVTDTRFAFEALQHDHDSNSFRIATDRSLLTQQEFEDKYNIKLTA
jgi:hypothetical protein